ncbi:MAG: hypothetical protein LBR94_03115 [Desulfovibrio sp.]|jgi:hypothetical protein|nr:hypothetical protein [Desulfovibrio sp.]
MAYYLDGEVKLNLAFPDSLPDVEKLAQYLPAVADALKAQGLSETSVKAALLSLCGVRVEASELKNLSLFGL